MLKPDEDAVKFLLGENTTQPDTTVLRSKWRPTQQVAISRGVNDSGQFELNFRDERYLPFEGTGAVSGWRLRLPQGSNRNLDFTSISDVIIQLRYTAFDGGDDFRREVSDLDSVKTYAGIRLLSLTQAYPMEWQKFMDSDSQSIDFTISADLFPVNLDPRSLKIGENGNGQAQYAIVTKDAIDSSNTLSLSKSSSSWVGSIPPESSKELLDVIVILTYEGTIKTAP